jgi:Zn-dependent M16 (insulinase) family peptidase
MQFQCVAVTIVGQLYIFVCCLRNVARLRVIAHILTSCSLLLWIRTAITPYGTGTSSVADPGCFSHPGYRISDPGSKNSDERQG